MAISTLCGRPSSLSGIAAGSTATPSSDAVRLIACVIVGTLSGIGFALLGNPYAVLLGVVGAIFEVVPLVGRQSRRVCSPAHHLAARCRMLHP